MIRSCGRRDPVITRMLSTISRTHLVLLALGFRHCEDPLLCVALSYRAFGCLVPAAPIAGW